MEDNIKNNDAIKKAEREKTIRKYEEIADSILAIYKKHNVSDNKEQEEDNER